MIRVLIELWPALLPIALFFAWHGVRRRAAIKRGKDVPMLKDGPWVYAVIAALAVAIACLFFWGAGQPSVKGSYHPAILEGDNIQEGTITP